MKAKIWIITALLSTEAPLARPQGPNGGKGPLAPVTQTAVISGTVLSETSGTGLGGAIVSAYRKSPQTPVYRSQGPADAKGAFSLASLPAGTYSLCVQVHGGAYLDPCSWSDSAPSVTVTDGQTSGGNTIRIKTGATLRVRIDDPGQHLKQRTNDPGPMHVLLLLIKSNGMTTPLPMTNSDAVGLNHQIVVPRDTNLKILAYSKEVNINDPDQKAVAAGGTSRDMNIPSGGPDSLQINYTVIGRRP